MSSLYGAPAPRRRRSAGTWILLICLLILPIVEIYLLVQVGQLIGAGWTILIVIGMAILGVWMMKREGAKTWRDLQTSLNAGRMPSRELADGALILAGGVLMVVPGFVTGAVGILLVLPFTRPPFRALLAALLARRATVVGVPRGNGGSRGGNAGPRTGNGPDDGPVVPGQVVDP